MWCPSRCWYCPRPAKSLCSGPPINSSILIVFHIFYTFELLIKCALLATIIQKYLQKVAALVGQVARVTTFFACSADHFFASVKRIEIHVDDFVQKWLGFMIQLIIYLQFNQRLCQHTKTNSGNT